MLIIVNINYQHGTYNWLECGTLSFLSTNLNQAIGHSSKESELILYYYKYLLPQTLWWKGSSLAQFTFFGDIVQNILYFIETLLAQVLPKLILAQQLTSIFILTRPIWFKYHLNMVFINENLVWSFWHVEAAYN